MAHNFYLSWIIVCLYSYLLIIQARPPENPIPSEETVADSEDDNNSTNFTAHNLYVIKTVIYEVGILTDVPENETILNDTLTNERVDLTFFNPAKDGSIIDLSNISTPIQTNVTGELITGFAPIQLGQLAPLNITKSQISGLPMFAPQSDSGSSESEESSEESSEEEGEEDYDNENNSLTNSIAAISSAINGVPFVISNRTIFSTSITKPED